MSIFKQRMAMSRQRLGFSQVELASKLGVSRSTIGMYETGEREPSFETVEKLAAILQVTPAYLTGWSDDQHSFLYGDSAPASPISTMLNNDLKDPPDDFIVLARKTGKIPEEDRKMLYNVIESTIDIVMERLKKEGKI